MSTSLTEFRSIDDTRSTPIESRGSESVVSPVVLQVISVIIGAIGEAVSSPAHPVSLDAGFSINGWLAVLLMFVLARVFAYGTRLRDDLEGTV